MICYFLFNLKQSTIETRQFRSTVQPLGGEYGQRRKRIDDVCRITNITHLAASIENKVYFEDRSVLYCGNLKVATTFMDGFLPHIFQCGNSTNCYSRPSRYKSLIDKAYSFTIVRDPYARLFSGYENKLFLPNKFWSTLGADVVAVVRPNASWSSLAIGHDVKFSEMVKYVIMKGSDERLNPHLMPMHKLCNPCQATYNFVGKLESMSTDIENLVSDLKQNHRVPVNTSSSFEIEADVRQKQLVGPVHHLFSTFNFLRKYASKSMHGKLRRNNIFLRTWSSFQIRGIILKNFSMPFNPTDHVTHDIYADAILTAAEKSAPFKSQLKAQRLEALVQAYKTVPMDLMEQLRDFVQIDCRLFGYDDRPAQLFQRADEADTDISPDEFNYFQGLFFPTSGNATEAEDQHAGDEE